MTATENKTPIEKTDEDLLEIPWFLSFKNPEVRAAHEKRHAQFRREQEAAAARRKATTTPPRPAKSTINNRRHRDVEPASTPKDVESKPEPKKAEAKDMAKPEPKKARKGGYDDNAIIRVLVDSFPHREGSKAAVKSGLFRDGMTVAEYKTAGDAAGEGLTGNWHHAHIRYCLEYRYIDLEG